MTGKWTDHDKEMAYAKEAAMHLFALNAPYATPAERTAYEMGVNTALAEISTPPSGGRPDSSHAPTLPSTPSMRVQGKEEKEEMGSRTKSVLQSMVRLLALSHVPRWCIVPRFRDQTVSDHVYRVMVILRALIKLDGTSHEESLNAGTMLSWALTHEIEEADSGDIPSNYKHHHDNAVPLLLKLADTIEAYTWISLWGAGAHAARVAEDLRAKVFAQANSIGGPIAKHIKPLLGAIEEDLGRFDTRQSE